MNRGITNKRTNSARDLLSYYGVAVAEYSGEGLLTFQNGQKVNCAFQAGQLTNGEVLLLCDFPLANVNPFDISVKRFEGKTSEGFQILADKGFYETNYLPDEFVRQSDAGIAVALVLGEMSVQMAEQEKSQGARFGLTNFHFIGTEGRQCQGSLDLVLPLNLTSEDSTVKLCIEPLKQYREIIKRVQTLETIDVTCEVVGEIAGNGGISILAETIDDLCYILSVARGTKITWIYCDQYNKAGVRTLRIHRSGITKHYCPSAIIDPRAGGRMETKAFIEQAYGTYVAKREAYKLNKGTIDAYLDAKAEHDYLEMRGAKLAVAMEMLKTVFLESPNGQATEHIIEKERFENLIALIRRAIDEILKSGQVSENLRQAISNNEKIKGLNRRSFHYLLRKFCRSISLEVESDIDLFVRCRNSLIHTGNFYWVRATDEEKERYNQLKTMQHEYHFLVNFLDKLFLKLLGYSGPYIDWSEPDKPKRAELE